MSRTFTITPQGPFSLIKAAGFGFGPRDAATEPVMRLAFCVDGYEQHAGVTLTQSDDGDVHGEIVGDGDAAAIQAQTARVVSLDGDGAAWCALDDPVLNRLQVQEPGLRPVNFHSPYEAAAWTVISLRWHRTQARKLMNTLGERYGATLDVSGVAMTAFPTPARALEVTAGDGLPQVKVDRLHAVARAALEGDLDVAVLRAKSDEQALTDLQKLPGIGPFASSLIVVRACGNPDTLPADEPITRAAVGHYYDLGGPATVEQMHDIAAGWAPFRTWSSVLVHYCGRNAGVTPRPGARARGASRRPAGPR